jgi:superfamily II DNA or RNA helicase
MIGKIGGGKRKPSGLIDIALIQSLVRKGEVDDIVGDYGHLIIDECYHLSAVSFEQVARRIKARYVLGLSATVTRKDADRFANVSMRARRQREAVRSPCPHSARSLSHAGQSGDRGNGSDPGRLSGARRRRWAQ